MTFSSTTLPKKAARLLFCAVLVQSLGAEPKCKNNKYWNDNFATNQMAYSQVIFGAAFLLLLVSNVFSRLCQHLSTNVKFWNWFHGNIQNCSKMELQPGDAFEPLCKNIFFVLCGFDPDQMNTTLLDTMVHHTPAGRCIVNFQWQISLIVTGSTNKQFH